MKHYFYTIPVLFIFFSCANIEKKDDIAINNPSKRSYSLVKVINGLNNPWGMTWLPDGAMLITEKSGELIHFKDGKKTNITNVPEVYNRG